ncbi:MAG: zf-HC2 domain-containing protein [Holophagales bacterium]|nr:zf-HC2 domain-containing protein [Holophagales bacterium]
MVERYLQGRLDAGESERFEDHYFECPECLEQLELAEMLQEGIRDTAAVEAPRALGVASSRARKPPGPHSRRQLLAAAALILISVAAGAVLHRLGGDLVAPADVAGLASPAANTPVFFLGPERSEKGTEPITRIRPRTELGGIVLALEVEAPGEGSLFRARLSSRQYPENPLWLGDELLVDHNGTLSLSLPSRFLDPGDYRLVVEPMGPDPEAIDFTQSFSFRILPQR